MGGGGGEGGGWNMYNLLHVYPDELDLNTCKITTCNCCVCLNFCKLEVLFLLFCKLDGL